jgi:hypothetical protein
MNVLHDCRSVFRSGIFAWLLLASTCNAASVDLIFASDFQNSQPIQWVRHHPKAGGVSIALGPAYVTALRVTSGGTLLTMYLQVPPGLNGNADYPLWSALKWFGNLSGDPPAIGDCVRAEGFIALFHGATELASAVWTAAPGECGDTPITPYVATSVLSVATDTDPLTVDTEPGASAEPLESVLVTLNSVTVQNSNGGTGAFKIGDASTGSYLSVAPFMYQYNSLAGTVLTSITGVFDEFDPAPPPDPPPKFYQLMPRSGADIVN